LDARPVLDATRARENWFLTLLIVAAYCQTGKGGQAASLAGFFAGFGPVQERWCVDAPEMQLETFWPDCPI
jgi:hypothetical protein